MAENRRAARALVRRLAGVALAFTLLAALAAPAWGTDIKHQLDAAKARLAELKDQVAVERAQLDKLGVKAAVLAQKVDEATAAWELITEQLRQTRTKLADARERYQELQDQLDARARETYMQGPGNNIEFLLGATSLADLSDRVTYVDALTRADADLANQVLNLRNDLAAQEADQEQLQAKASAALQKKQAQEAALEAQLAQEQQVVDDINAKIAEATDLVQKLGRQYTAYLAAMSGLQFHNGTILKVCPVDQPRVVVDGFGAPRYAGGYHPHAGNDIVAPLGTPIRAPFDGTARSSWNSLGGNSVYVYGADGYVYNAHLDHYSDLSDGPVSAGDVIGYVGNTGDAQGGITHDHFEWHPNVIPSDWPKSPYGYDVIGSAVNPYPLLQQVC
jgi:murein DD-endopeptidase MepM/ murein hydrolase activator NlpD